MSRWALMLIALACALSTARVRATGVPIAGFAPLVGISLTDRFKDENAPGFTFFQADYETSLVGTQFGTSGTPYYDVALLDTGAAVTLITAEADAGFNIEGAGFRGDKELPLGGASGALTATINDPMAIFATGLGNRTGTAPLTFDNSPATTPFIGQSSISLATLPEESALPNILGIPFSSQYATYIRSDQPQIFQLNGKTVRTPQIEFRGLGTGADVGITRRATITLDDPTSFTSPPQYVYDIFAVLNGGSYTDNPMAPTVRANANLQVAAAYFLNVTASNNGQSLNSQFFFDTGADVTVISEQNALSLGFDVGTDTPEFTVAIVGSGGTVENVPGFFADSFTIPATGGSITLQNVPIIVFDVVNPAHPGNFVDGIVGTNLLAGRNVVIDPKPAQGTGGSGPRLYIGDSVTNQKNWTTAAASGTFNVGSNWSGSLSPTNLSIANVRHVSGGNQTATVTTDATVWELNISGGPSSQTMTVQLQNGVTLTTFSGVNIEQNGVIELQNGTLDTQYVEIMGGTLRGAGIIRTGSGPIDGQVENRMGTVAPGTGVGVLNIAGRFANGIDGTLAMELGGTTAATQYDQVIVDGAVSLEGTLAVTLANLGSGTFAPSVGNSFTLLTATDLIGGEFDHLVLPGGYLWNIAYNPHSVILTMSALAVAGDYNKNGVVDAADYVVWRNSMGAMGAGLEADGNGDQMVNQDDLVFWKSRFGKTSGSGSALSANVPEPASAGLVLLGVLVLGMRRPLNRKR